MILIHPTYFPTIAAYAMMTSGDKIKFEVSDFYEKQTFRNRTYIQSANAKQMLSVQVKHTHADGKQFYKDVLVSNDFDWQKLHWRSLETAYRTSPYFEFYEDDLQVIFEKKYKFLVDLNCHTIEILNNLLELDINSEKTTAFHKNYDDTADFRYLKNAKTKHDFIDQFPKYTQMFLDRHDFMPNLSVLDLLFMEGPNTITYLNQVRNLLQASVVKP